MQTILTFDQVHQLIVAMEDSLQTNGCDHTLKHGLNWASDQAVDLDDLIDALEACGCWCDCEIVMNLVEEEDLKHDDAEVTSMLRASWHLPPSFRAESDQRFTKVLSSNPEAYPRSAAPRGDILVPAPFGAKARKRIRKSVHFFIGLESGMPNELGYVTATDPMTAAMFAKSVRDSGHEELSSFGPLEATFHLTRLAGLKEGTPVGTHFMEVQSEDRTRQELRVHRVVFKGKGR